MIALKQKFHVHKIAMDKDNASNHGMVHMQYVSAILLTLGSTAQMDHEHLHVQTTAEVMADVSKECVSATMMFGTMMCGTVTIAHST